MILNKDGIKKVKKACDITAKIINDIVKELKKGSFETELDVYRWLKKETYSNNCKLAYNPVVGMQENAAEIHHKADGTKLKKGFLVIDFGVKYKGYCSDCTRTFYLGRPNKKEIELYNLVLDAQLTALNEVKIGNYAANVDLVARAALWDYFMNFVHGTGHGLGKKIHMAPRISPNSKNILKENQMITVEPGLYFKNKLGIRIEDTLIVKKRPIIFTDFTKKMIIINR